MRTFASMLCIITLAVLISPVLASPVLEGPDVLSLSAAGNTGTLPINLSGAGTGLSGYNLSIELSNPGTAEIAAVTFPSWAGMPVNGTMPAANTWIQAVDLRNEVEPGDSSIPLATLTIRALASGEATLTVIPVIIDDDQGGRYTLEPLRIPVRIGGMPSVTIDSDDHSTVLPASSSPSVDGTAEALPSSPVSTASETTESTATSAPSVPSPSPAVPATEQATPSAEATPGFDGITTSLSVIAFCAIVRQKMKGGA